MTKQELGELLTASNWPMSERETLEYFAQRWLRLSEQERDDLYYKVMALVESARIEVAQRPEFCTN